MTEHRKSHPPETSLSSRELAIRLIQMPVDAVDRGEQLIDAWVRVREAAARAAAVWIFREQYQAAMMDTGGDREAATYCGLQAIEKMTPADVHKGGTHGQAEVPSAAASANSEPGGA